MSKPKILFYDIETAPVLALIWRPGYNMSVNHDQLLDGEKNDIICIGYRWAHQKRAKCLVWDNKKQCSEKMIQEFTKIVEQADVVIAHNGDRFDLKHINTQRLLHDQTPIAWPTSEDTLKMVKKHFNFPANNLDYLAKVLLGSKKNPMSWADWVNIKLKKKGHEKNLKKMVDYCKKDVDLLCEVWEKIAPYCEVKVSRSLIVNNNREGCPSCGSIHSHKHDKITLKSGKYQRYKCQDCGHVWRYHKKLKDD